MDPYWGKTKYNDSIVAGWQLSDDKRYRLDYDPEYAKHNAEVAAWSGTPELKGSKGVHVNEENHRDAKPGQPKQVCHPTRASLQWADTQWRKWTKRFDAPK